MVRFFAGLSESEDPRQTECRWQQLIQTKTVLQIPPSLKPPDRNKEWKCSYQTQIKLFYRDIHDRAGANNFISRLLTRAHSSALVRTGCQVRCRILYFSKKCQPPFIFHFMPKYFPIVWKLALNLSEACVLHRKAFIFTFPRPELHSPIQGRHDNENTFPFPIDQTILACGTGRSWLKSVNFMPNPEETSLEPVWHCAD